MPEPAETPSSISTSAGEIGPWLRLQGAPGVGPVCARRLLAAFGTPDRLFAAGARRVGAVAGAAVAQALFHPPAHTCASLIERTRQWLAQPGHAVVTLADSAYPPALLTLPDPPLLLYVRGRLDLLARPAVAVVGSRQASAQGRLDAAGFAEALCRAGYTVVSGLAAGIDASAHEGALRSAAAAATVAVIGTGCDLVYPARHRALADAIAARGAIVSEYALGTPPAAANFPRRNRLISGLARAVLVVEAAAGSGSLITARLAAEQGRDVYALPGSIHAPLAKGCHQLIKDGARLVETVPEMIEELEMAYGPPPAPAPAGMARDPADAPTAGQAGAAMAPPGAEADTQAEAGNIAGTASPVSPASPASQALPAVPVNAALLDQLGFAPTCLDALALRSGLAIAGLQAALLALELDGLVERLPGAKYRRLA